MEKSPNYIRCDGAMETLDHSFFHFRFVVPLGKFIEDMFRMLPGGIFVLKGRSVCINVVPSFRNAEHCVLFLDRCYASCDMKDTS